MGCCQNCDHGTGPCIEGSTTSTALAVRQSNFSAIAPRRRHVGAISTATVAGVPVVAAAGGVAGGWGGWTLASMVAKRSTILKVIGLAAGAYAGYVVAPKATDAVGL